jgi:hypothetical protein
MLISLYRKRFVDGAMPMSMERRKSDEEAKKRQRNGRWQKWFICNLEFRVGGLMFGGQRFFDLLFKPPDFVRCDLFFYQRLLCF